MKPRTWNLPEILRRRDRSRLLGGLALAAFCLLAVLIARMYIGPPPATVKISAGNTEGVWHQLILKLARESAEDRLPMEPVVTRGTIDMLGRIDRGEIDFAVIQGGFDMTKYGDVRQVAVLSSHPLHLLVKPEYHEAVARDFGQLRGKTINLGSGRRAGTYWLSREILSFAGLSPADYRASAMTSDEIGAQRDKEHLPDAVFIATTPPSELVRWLVSRFNYRLVPLPFGDAFRASASRPELPLPADGIPVRKEHIPDATIAAYSYEVSPPVPAQAVATLGCRVLLITNERTSNGLVIRLLDDLLSSRHAEWVQPPLTAEIVRQPAEVPWHPGSLQYRKRGEPVITGELIGVLSNTLQLLLPMGGGLLLVWGWFRNRILTRNERRIDRFIALVSGVEQRALALGQEGVPDRRAVRELHRELSTIKDAALERIASGEAGNPLLVSSLFAHISDVRANLADLDRGEPDPDAGVAAS